MVFLAMQMSSIIVRSWFVVPGGVSVVPGGVPVSVLFLVVGSSAAMQMSSMIVCSWWCS